MPGKPRSLPRSKAIIKQAEVIELLGRALFQDAVAAGWLKARSVKIGKLRARAMVYYASTDVTQVEERILKGEYPKKI